MSDTRRLFVKRALTAAGGLVTATGLPQESYAGCTSATRSYVVARPEDVESRVNIADWKLGDCELKDASVTITPTNVIIFNGQVCTHFTHTKDVWHIHLQLLTKYPQKVIWFDKSFVGPQMSEQDKPLFHSWSESFPFNPSGATLPRRMQLDITSCC